MSERDVAGLRVLMTADTVGGVFTYALTLATELGRRGATVHIATMGGTMRPCQREAAAALGNVVLHESTYALEWMSEPWEDVARAAEWLLEVEREVSPDIVHLNGYAHGSAGFRAPVVIVGHSCVLSWWQAVLGEPAPPEFDRYRIEVTRGLAAAGAVIAPTAAMMRSLRTHYGPLASRAVVFNGAPAPTGKPTATKERAVLAAGRLWDRAKNIEALARVAPGFAGPVRVAGADRMLDGSTRGFPNVELLGWLDPPALSLAMEAAAIFAHPARYEPFGLAPLEAALRRCALVLGDIESLREIWADAAAYVAPDDDEALAIALDRFACDEDLRREYAERAAARAALFTPERMAEGTVAVYARLLGESRAGSGSRDRGAMPSCA
ncbi:MAG: glycosyl transferase family 1 [Labilithrix sp.]|nr:glycosyl transferase family 1 [Labilithrix sp.]